MKTSIISSHSAEPSFCNLKRFAVVILFMLIAHIAKPSSPDTIFITEPPVVNVCAESHFSATFNNTGTFGVKINSAIVISTLIDDTIMPVCPPGGPGTDAVKIQIDSSANCVVIPMGSNEWSITDTSSSGNSVIYYSVFVDCSILSDTSFVNTVLAMGIVNNQIELKQSWIDTLTNMPILLYDGQYNNFIKTLLHYPLIRKYTSNEIANYKGTRDSLFLYFVYWNAGNAANIEFNFHDSLNCGSYSIIGNPGFAITTTGDTTSKDTLTYTGFTPGVDTAINIPDGEFLIIREHIVIDSCMPCNNDVALLTWHCNAAISCTACQENYKTTFTIDTLGTRKVAYSRLWPTNAGYDLSCNGDTVNWWFKFENTGQVGLKKLNIALDYHFQGNNALTLIDTSSIQIIKSDPSILVTDTLGNPFPDPSNCTNCYHIFPSGILPQCTAQIPYQFESFKFSVHDLRPAKGALPAQYVLLGFSTYRCATSDDSLLDVPKYFNEWAIGVTPTDECGDTLPGPNINSGGIYYNTLTGGISGESEKSEGIHQTLNLSTTVTNLTIPPGPGTGVRYGDKAQIAVDLDGITGNPNDGAEYDHFGCINPTQPFACNLKGFIKARIFCESGLLVADTNAFLNYNLVTLRPVLAYADTSNPFACDSGSYTFIFDLSLDTNAYEILNFGQFIFTMGSCCPTANPQAAYKIAFYLLADPVGNCYSNILGAPYDYNKLDTAALTWLPLSSAQNSIEIACPGCKAPGMVAFRYSLDRITYGLADSDNDRICDTTLVPVDSSYTLFNKINVKNSMHGDKLLDRLSAHLQDGDSTSYIFDPVPGYTYSQMLANNSKLRYLQLLRSFQLMDSMMDVRIEQFILYIDKIDSTNADTCYDCAAYGISPYNFSTMAVLSVDTSQLSLYVTKPSANNRLYTFHDSLLEYHSIPLPNIIYQSSDTAFQFHGYNVDQRYRLSVIYNVCGNFEALFPPSPIKSESNIINKMWMSGAAHPNGSVLTMPNNIDELDTAGWTLDTIAFPVDTLINQNFADSYLFLCSTTGGRHFFYSNEQKHSRTFILNPGNCDKRLAIIAESTIGNSTESDIFPFEFRRPAFSPVSWDVKLPPYYYFKNPVLARTYAYYQNYVSHALDPEIITDTASIVFGTLTDTCHITLSQLPLIDCLKDTADNTLSAGDQKIYAEIILQAGDSACSEGANDTIRAKIIFTDNDTLACQNSNNHFCGTDSVIKSSINTLPIINPNLGFSSSPNVAQAIQPKVCWRTHIENISGTNVTPAYNVFIIPPNYSYMSNWTITVNNITYPLSANTPFIVAPLLNPGNFVNDTLCADYAPCLPDTGIRHLVLHWGWNCDSVIAIADSACGYFIDSIAMEPHNASLKTEDAIKDSITLCQPFNITAVFTNSNLGSAFPLIASVDSLPAGLTVVNCIAMINSAIDTLTTTDSIHWNFPPGAEAFSHDTIYVILTLYPNCGFFALQDTLPAITLEWVKYCGDTLTNFVTFGAPVQSIDTPSVCTNCSCSDITIIHIADSVFSYPSYGSGINNTSVLIQGRFYVDSNFTFTNCTVYTNPGAQIIVLNLSTFTLDSTVIIGCDSMWRGIYMEGERTTFIEKNGSDVRDAEFGLHNNQFSAFRVLNSSMTNCVTGIYIPPLPVIQGFSAVVQGSNFGLDSSGFKPDFSLQSPHGLIPKAGILANDAIFTIGSDTVQPNQFYNMNTGVTGLRSRLKIYNSLFERMNVDSFYHKTYSGTAMVSHGDKDSSEAGSLIVMPQVSATPIVQNSYRGIYTGYSSLSATGLNFVNLNTGVYSSKCADLLTSVVSNCKMEVSRYGIYWINNKGALSMTASSDTIVLKSPVNIFNMKSGTGAIVLIEPNRHLPVNYSVFNNTISMDSASFGILATNVLKPNITFNKIKINAQSPLVTAQGITISGCDSSSVTCNDIFGKYPVDSSYHSTGIATNVSTRNSITCNTVDSTYYGIFFGSVSPSRFRGNEMNTHFEGLHLNSAAVIDTQAHAGNIWNGPFTGYDANNLNYNPQPNLLLSLFVIDSMLASQWFPTNIPGVNAGWFTAASGNTFYCSNYTACTVIHNEDISEELARRIAEDSLQTSEFEFASQIMAEMYLYEQLKNDTALLASDSLYRQFMQTEEFSSTAYLYEASIELRATAEYDSTFTVLINETDSLIEYYTNVLEYTHEYDSIAYLLGFLEQTRSNLVEVRNSLVQEYYGTATLNNRFTVPVGLPDSNEVFMDLMQLYMDDPESEYANSEVSPEEEIGENHYSEILAIAQQCPYAGGPAVYRARAFIAMLNDTSDVAYNDVAACLLAGIYRKGNIVKAKENNSIQIIPNPASDYLKIILNNSSESLCRLSILNSLGEELIVKTLDCKQKEYVMNISILSQGAYYIKINLDNEPAYGKKLMIIR